MGKRKNAEIPVYNVALQDCSDNTKQVKDFEIHRLEALLQDITHVNFPHRHAFYNVLIITKGSGTHTIDFQEYEVKPGRLFLMTEGQIHSWSLSDNIEGYTLFFTREFYTLHCHMQDFYSLPFFHNDFDLPYTDLPTVHPVWAKLKTLAEGMLLENQYQDNFKPRICWSYLNLMLLQICRFFHAQNEGKNTIRPSLVREFELKLHEHFVEKRSVADYAETLHITPNYLNTLTKKTLGKSAKEIINQRLVLEIKRLLYNSDLNISQVAYSLNFNDVAYFSRFFKKHTGLTPEAFRQQKSKG